MCCDNTMRLMNDFLDKTLSKNEERKIKSHLEKCEACRNEYQNLEKADNTLRQVICEMVADIDVPVSLSGRIEKLMSDGDRRSTPWSRMLVLMKTPAAAAALLFVVLLSGFFTYNNYFNVAYNQKVALSEKDTGNYRDGAVMPASDKAGAVLNETADTIKDMRADSDLVKNPDILLKDAPEIIAESPVKKQLENTTGALGGQPAPAAATAPDELNKPQPADDQRDAFIKAAPLGLGGEMPASNRGTMEEAAMNVGFIPSKPVYLPQGAVLSDVSWLPDETSQNYRLGRYYFTVSQNRMEPVDLEYSEKYWQGSAVDINGMRGFLQENRPEAVDAANGTITTLRWRQGYWAFSVSGDLPAEEIIKISLSVK